VTAAASFLVLFSACADDAENTPATITPGRSPTATTEATQTSTFPLGLQQALVTEVADGDTIRVTIDGQEFRVRYIGIDTPETNDPLRGVECYGPESTVRNKQLVEGKTVGLEADVSNVDEHGRLLRYVWLNGEMVNTTLVREGFAQAVAYPPDTKHQDLLEGAEGEARAARLGVWSDSCAETPAATLPAVSVGAGQCEFSGTDEALIKGNISRDDGERIYHVPGQENYEVTQINEANGERWFCTEAEAVAAGWRRALR
jgi:micrococcal nuclease